MEIAFNVVYIGCNQYVFLSNYKDAIIMNKLVHQARL